MKEDDTFREAILLFPFVVFEHVFVWPLDSALCMSHIFFFAPTFDDVFMGTGDKKMGDLWFFSFK